MPISVSGRSPSSVPHQSCQTPRTPPKPVARVSTSPPSTRVCRPVSVHLTSFLGNGRFFLLSLDLIQSYSYRKYLDIQVVKAFSSFLTMARRSHSVATRGDMAGEPLLTSTRAAQSTTSRLAPTASPALWHPSKSYPIASRPYSRRSSSTYQHDPRTTLSFAGTG